jgi:hypothetical protein
MKTTPVRAIRRKCSECAGSPRAATRCEKEDCALHPYRAGRNPNRRGIGRSDLHKDAHSGKFRPSQDGRNVSISRSSEGSTPGFNTGQPHEENGEVGRKPLSPVETMAAILLGLHPPGSGVS